MAGLLSKASSMQ